MLASFDAELNMARQRISGGNFSGVNPKHTRWGLRRVTKALCGNKSVFG